MENKLASLVRNAHALVASGYYEVEGTARPGASLVRAIRDHPTFPIIAEVKLASPSCGTISDLDPSSLCERYLRAGVAGISVLTEPNHFSGSLGSLDLVPSDATPVLMKDIIVAEAQLVAAAAHGASAVLLIQEVFSLSHLDRDILIDRAHTLGLEVVLEAGSEGMLSAAARSEADLLGINQRDLRTFVVDDRTGERLLPLLAGSGRPTVVMSGISRREQIERVRDRGGSAVLIGTHLSSSADPDAALRQLAVAR